MKCFRVWSDYWEKYATEAEPRYASQKQLVKQTGFTQGLVSAVLNGKRSHHKGYAFKYECEAIGNVHENPELLEEKE